MPVHDWTRVDPAVFHSFHLAWIAEICKALNNGGLPEDFYALAEQHADRSITELLARRHTINYSILPRRRTLAIRHISGHRLIAIVEIVSPRNKNCQDAVEEFVVRIVDAIDAGVHVILIDLFPPGRFDVKGTHDVIWRRLSQSGEPHDLPAEPLTVASYSAGADIDVHGEHLATGSPLPDTPLFLGRHYWVNVPFEATYQMAYRGMPAIWRDVLEGKKPS